MLTKSQFKIFEPLTKNMLKEYSIKEIKEACGEKSNNALTLALKKFKEENIRGIELYKALRNVLLVRLLLNKIIDNKKLHESINMEIGENLIKKLKENRESKEERKLIKYYLKNLIKETYKMLEGDLWEKRVELKV